MELDTEKSVFKDSFPFLTYLNHHNFLFALYFNYFVVPQISSLWAPNLIVRIPGFCIAALSAHLFSPGTQFFYDFCSLETFLPSLRYWSLYLRPQEQITLVFKLLELANGPLCLRNSLVMASFTIASDLICCFFFFLIGKLVFTEYSVV